MFMRKLENGRSFKNGLMTRIIELAEMILQCSLHVIHQKGAELSLFGDFVYLREI